MSLDHPRCQQRGQKHRQKGLHREGEVVKAAERVKEGSRERVEGLLAACARETCSEGHRSTNTDVGVGGKEREWEARSPWYFICCYRWRNNGRVRTARVPGPKMGTMAVCTCLAPHNQFYCRRRSSRSAGPALWHCHNGRTVGQRRALLSYNGGGLAALNTALSTDQLAAPHTTHAAFQNSKDASEWPVPSPSLPIMDAIPRSLVRSSRRRLVARSVWSF